MEYIKVIDSFRKQNGFYGIKIKTPNGSEITDENDFVKITTKYKIHPTIMVGSFQNESNEKEYFYTYDFFKIIGEQNQTEQLINAIYAIEKIMSQFPGKSLEDIFETSSDGSFNVKENINVTPPSYSGPKDDPNWCLNADPCVPYLKPFCCSDIPQPFSLAPAPAPASAPAPAPASFVPPPSAFNIESIPSPAPAPAPAPASFVPPPSAFNIESIPSPAPAPAPAPVAFMIPQMGMGMTQQIQQVQQAQQELPILLPTIVPTAEKDLRNMRVLKFVSVITIIIIIILFLLKKKST